MATSVWLAKKTSEGVNEKSEPRRCHWKVNLTTGKHHSKEKILCPISNGSLAYGLSSQACKVQSTTHNLYISIIQRIAPMFCCLGMVYMSDIVFWLALSLERQFSTLQNWHDSFTAKMGRHCESLTLIRYSLLSQMFRNVFLISIFFLSKEYILLWKSSVMALLTQFFMWGFVTHAAIEGYSRKIMYLQSSTNNKACTVLGAFLEPVENFGLPSCIRAD